MGYQLGLPAALAARGVAVETVPGWQTRGSAAFTPRGVVCHWTAGPATGDRPSLSVVVNGRSDLPGPLAQVFLTRAGVAIVVAAGRANHAGVGSWRGLTGNSAVFGIEAESTGRGDWTAAQRAAYPRVVAALLDLTGTGPESVCGHSEWAPSRKIDIRDWTMADMRAQVSAITGTPNTPTPPTCPDLLEETMPVRIRTATGGIYYVDVTRGNFRALDPTANASVDKLGVPIVRDNLSPLDRDQIRQVVKDLATPRIDG